jgi:hypothetical protein
MRKGLGALSDPRLGGYYGGMLLKGAADVAFLVRPGRAAQLADSRLVVAYPVKTLLAGAVDGPTISCCSLARLTISTARSRQSPRRSGRRAQFCQC